MRRRYLTEADVGTERIRRIFLILPRKFNGDWRWWEYAYIKESVREVPTEMWSVEYCWCADGWVEEPEIEPNRLERVDVS